MQSVLRLSAVVSNLDFPLKGRRNTVNRQNFQTHLEEAYFLQNVISNTYLIKHVTFNDVFLCGGIEFKYNLRYLGQYTCLCKSVVCYDVGIYKVVQM
jgi:hypothetical protein